MLFGLLWAHFKRSEPGCLACSVWQFLMIEGPPWSEWVAHLCPPVLSELALHHQGGSEIIYWLSKLSQPSQQMWCSAYYPHTIHALLAEHWRLWVFSSQAGGMRRADLLRAGGAAAVIHFRLVNVRQKALVAVFIWRREEGKGTEHEVTALTAFLKYILLCISLEPHLISLWNEQ